VTTRSPEIPPRETFPEITRRVARRTLEQGQKVSPALRTLAEHDIKSAWSGAICCTLGGFPKGLRLRPGVCYQEAAFPGPATPPSSES
jgi:hypothetical protein